MKILLAEDEPSTRLLVERILAKMGHDITSAACAEDVGFYLRSCDFDMFITDLSLGDSSAIEIIQQLRDGVCSRNLNVPVVILSGQSASIMQNEYQRLGIQAYIEKPFSPSDLRNTVEKLQS